MNAEVYLFGDFGSGYTQYIDDNSRTLFKSIASKSKANSQLIIHRDDTLMYYTYVRRLHNAESSNSRYIGISYVLNNHFIRDIDGLFNIFEGAITTIVSRGVLLEYTDSGNIIATLGMIYNAKSEFAHISSYLKNELDIFMAGKNDTLPPLDYSINTAEEKTFKFNDSRSDIINALSTFPTVYIFKDEDYENEESKSYASTLFRLNKENISLRETNSKLARQKKQIKVVAWLSVIIAVGIIIFFFVMQSKNDTIVSLQKDKNQLQTHVDALQTDSTQLTKELNETESKLTKFQEQVNSLTQDNITLTLRIDSCFSVINQLRIELVNNPLIIYDIEIANQDYYGNTINNYGTKIYSSQTKYLKPKIKYVGINSGNDILKVKIYTPDGALIKGTTSPSDCTERATVYVKTGKQECTSLLGWGSNNAGIWRSGNYKIEIWYSSTCLFSKSFTIY